MKGSIKFRRVVITTRTVFSFFMSLCLVHSSFSLFSQANNYKLINSYETKVNYVNVDNFGNVYGVGDNQLVKLDKEGKFQQRYEEVKYGKIGSVDVSNPMKITVYYPDFMTAVVLDKFLSPLVTYSFFDLGYQTVTAASSSSDGYLWFYDNVSFTLKKIDETGKVKTQSQPVNQLIDKIISPSFIVEKNGQVYVNDTMVGILMFDNFGAYSKTIPIHGLQKIQVLQDQIVYFQDKKLKSYNIITFDTKMVTLPDSNGVISAAIEKERIALLKADKIDIYKY